MNAARRGPGERDSAWDEVPLLEGEARAAENLPLFDAGVPAEEPRPGERRRARRAESAAPSRDAASPEPDERAWVQASLDAGPEPAPPPSSSATTTRSANGGVAPRHDIPVPPRLAERLLAGLADAVLHLAVLAGGLVAESLLGLQPAPSQWPGFVVFLICFSFLYTTVPLAFWGQTPGMAWRGLRARDGERPLHFGQTALRWLGALATVALAGLPLLLALGGRSFADRLSRSETFVEAS